MIARARPYLPTVLLAFGTALSLALVVWMFWQAPWERFASEGRWLMDHVWGQIALLDLYSGFLLTLALVWLFEPRLVFRLLLTIAVPLLGNPVIAIWLILRWKRLKTMARPPSFD